MQSKNIVYVDDQKVNHHLLQHAIEDQYQITCFKSSTEALASIPSIDPDLILLDVEMPELSGYELCLNLRMRDDLAETPIIFLSAKDDLNSRIKGYEVGGCEYITKPIEREILLAKFDVLLANSHAVKRSRSEAFESRKELEQSCQAISNALQVSGDSSIQVSFMEASQNCDSFEELIQKLFDHLSIYEICGTAEVKVEGNYYDIPSHGAINPLQVEILCKTQNTDRVFKKDNILTVNYPMVSILFDNMPFEDELKYGRLCDLCVQLAGIANQRIEAIQACILLNSYHQELSALCTMMQEKIKSSQYEVRNTVQRSISFMEELIQDSAIPETIENRLVNLSEHMDVRFGNFMDNLVEFENKFDHMIISEKKIVDLLNHK